MGSDYPPRSLGPPSAQCHLHPLSMVLYGISHCRCILHNGSVPENRAQGWWNLVPSSPADASALPSDTQGSRTTSQEVQKLSTAHGTPSRCCRDQRWGVSVALLTAGCSRDPRAHNGSLPNRAPAREQARRSELPLIDSLSQAVNVDVCTSAPHPERSTVRPFPCIPVGYTCKHTPPPTLTLSIFSTVANRPSGCNTTAKPQPQSQNLLCTRIVIPSGR